MTLANLLIERIRDVTVVTLQDDQLLDAARITRVADALYELVEKQDRRRMVVDFSKIKSLSSMTLGVLLTLKQKIDERGGRLVLTGLAGTLRRLFELAALDRVFDFAPSADEALAAFGVSATGG